MGAIVPYFKDKKAVYLCSKTKKPQTTYESFGV